ncbi:DEAD-box ATP-dependent RNA helicase 27-like protein [Drosera capensis]
MLLYNFLKKNNTKKVVVFFSTCDSVEYYSAVLKYIQIDCFDTHERQKQQNRSKTFSDFCEAERGILLCTDVAGRGLDIPAVDRIVQYDTPNDPEDGSVPVVEHDYDERLVRDIWSHLEKLVFANFYLNKAAKKAYRSYIQAYNSLPMRDVFNVHNLNLEDVAASFCFTNPPYVDLHA